MHIISIKYFSKNREYYFTQFLYFSNLSAKITVVITQNLCYNDFTENFKGEIYVDILRNSLFFINNIVKEIALCYVFNKL